MLTTLIRKEFTLAVLTYRFGIGLVLCLVAVTAGTMAVVADYQSRQGAYQEARRVYGEKLSEQGPYALLVHELAAFRAPRPLGVFAVGADRWQGNRARLSHKEVPYKARWLGAANPYMAVFNSIDLVLIVQVIIGLIALTFAYDAVSGEAEDGTLKQVLSNPVPRDLVLLGKALGHGVALGLILVVGFLLALLISYNAGVVDLGADALARLGLMLALSALYVAALYILGLLTSCLARDTSMSLVLCIFIWLIATTAYPNAVVYAVEHLGRDRALVAAKESVASDLNSQFGKQFDEEAGRLLDGENPQNLFEFETSSSSGLGGYFYGTFFTEEALQQWIKDNPEQWKEIQAWMAAERAKGNDPMPPYLPSAEVARRVGLLSEFAGRIERLRVETADRIWREARQPQEQEARATLRRARALGLLSPAGAYRQAMTVLARTDRQDYWHFLESARRYRRQLVDHYGGQGWFDARTWYNTQEQEGDLRSLPRYREPGESVARSLGRAAAPVAVLLAFNLVGAALVYIRFRRYDLSREEG